MNTFSYFLSIYFNLNTKLHDLLALRVLVIPAIKKQVEEYIDDVGKIAHNVRGKLQVITIDVKLDYLLQVFSFFFFGLLKINCTLMKFSSPELTP